MKYGAKEQVHFCLLWIYSDQALNFIMGSLKNEKNDSIYFPYIALGFVKITDARDSIFLCKNFEKITYSRCFCVPNEIFKTVDLNIHKFIHSFISLFSNYLPSASPVSAAPVVAGTLKA